MKYTNEIDCHGSSNLKVYNENGSKYYKKGPILYIKKFILEYIQALSKELNVPMIDYQFNEEESQYYFISNSYDINYPDYQVIIKPFECEDEFELLVKMKDFCSKYENGSLIYQKFLKQMLFSILICDPDRTVDNIKLYSYNNKLEIAPYMDIDLVFDFQEDDPLFMDCYYKFPKEMKNDVDKINETSDGSYYYTVDELNKEFEKEFEIKKDIFLSNLYDMEDKFKLLDYIYKEIDNKNIFDMIVNLNYEELVKKYNLNISNNANKIIRLMFITMQSVIKSYYDKKIIKDVNMKL